MVKITIDDKDLEQMPQEMREMLLEFLIKSKKVDETNIVASPDLESADLKETEADFDIDENESLINFDVDTMTLEAAVALCAGLNAKTSLKCLEALVDRDELSRKQIADMTGSLNEKGINGLIGSINRRFKGLISDKYAKPNLVNYLKNSQSYYIQKEYRVPLRFAIWAVSHGIDWEGCVSVIWEVDNPDEFASKLELNVLSIKGFLDKSQLGVEVSHSFELGGNGDYNTYIYHDVSKLCNYEGLGCLIYPDPYGNGYVSYFDGKYTGGSRVGEIDIGTGISSLFTQPEVIKLNGQLGKLVAFYSDEEAFDYAYQKALTHLLEFPKGEKGKKGFYWDNFIPPNNSDGPYKRGAFFWFDNSKSLEVFKLKVFKHTKGIIEHHGDIIYGNSNCSWFGNYESLFGDPEEDSTYPGFYVDAPEDNYLKEFIHNLRGFFFTEVLNQEPYEGAIKEEHGELFAKAIEDFRLK